MGLLAQALAEGAPIKGHYCEACKWISAQDEETQREARQMIGDRSWSPMSIAVAWRALGFQGDNSVIDIHRKSKAGRG